MPHYRLYKLDREGGAVTKGKDLEEEDDRAAVRAAQRDPDCPVCEIWRGARKIAIVR